MRRVGTTPRVGDYYLHRRLEDVAEIRSVDWRLGPYDTGLAILSWLGGEERMSTVLTCDLRGSVTWIPVSEKTVEKFKEGTHV